MRIVPPFKTRFTIGPADNAGLQPSTLLAWYQCADCMPCSVNEWPTTSTAVHVHPRSTNHRSRRDGPARSAGYWATLSAIIEKNLESIKNAIILTYICGRRAHDRYPIDWTSEPALADGARGVMLPRPRPMPDTSGDTARVDGAWVWGSDAYAGGPFSISWADRRACTSTHETYCDKFKTPRSAMYHHG